MDLDPRLTDEEIIATFTPMEQQFHDWIEETGENERNDLIHRPDEFFARFAVAFPGREARLQFHIYSGKWAGRGIRRFFYSIPPDEFIARLGSTKCNDKTQLCETKLYMTAPGVPDLMLGQSEFGGTLVRYAVQTGPGYLFPDVATAIRGDNTLERAVLAIDIDVDANIDTPAPITGPYTTQPTLNLPQDSDKGRRENISSGEESAVSMRSAESDDFLDQEPFVFLQIGALLCCTDEEEQTAVQDYMEEPREAEYSFTGYGVVVRLTRGGYPTGAVYIVYNYQEALPPVQNPDPNQPSFWKEREWRDELYRELPDIRRLYPECDRQFFLGKIASSLSDLKADAMFDIQVIRESRMKIVTAKMVGVQRKIIPSEITVETGNENARRG